MENNFNDIAIDAGERMASILIEEGHDSLGVKLSLQHFRKGMEELFDQFEAKDPADLAELALTTAAARLEHLTQH